MSNLKIHFFEEQCHYKIRNKSRLKRGIQQIISDSRKNRAEINIVICRDEFLLEYNRRFLKRDYLTDVISFDLSDEEQIIYGEVYISIDRIKENAAKYRISVEEELARVIFHGALHLTGFNDNTERERKEMQKQEEIYLKSSEIQ